jgi:hypothetical protein
MIDLAECTPEQVTAQARYLANTPVSNIAELVASGQARLWSAKIQSLLELGAIETIFGNVGTLKPPGAARRFRVSEVRDVLEKHGLADPRMRADIDSFMASDAEGQVDYNVTIVRSAGELVIVDGNKRTIAFFERRRNAGSDRIDFPAFVVDGIRLGA